MEDRCVHCNGVIDKDSTFCKHCGQNQYSQQEEQTPEPKKPKKKSGFVKFLQIFLLAVIIFFVIMYLIGRNSLKKYEEKTITSDPHSKSDIQNDLKDKETSTQDMSFDLMPYMEMSKEDLINTRGNPDSTDTYVEGEGIRELTIEYEVLTYNEYNNFNVNFYLFDNKVTSILGMANDEGIKINGTKERDLLSVFNLDVDGYSKISEEQPSYTTKILNPATEKVHQLKLNGQFDKRKDMYIDIFHLHFFDEEFLKRIE